MWRWPTADQYAPLGDDLTRQAATGRRQVVLPFAQLEVAILGRVLPPRARGPSPSCSSPPSSGR